MDDQVRSKAVALLRLIAQQYGILLGVQAEDLLAIWGGDSAAPAEPPADEPGELPAPSRATIKQQVHDAHKAHPEWTVRDIAKSLSRPVPTVQRHVEMQGLPVPARRKRQVDPGAFGAGSKFRLVDPESGKFLHQDLAASNNEKMLFTGHAEFAWCGTERQLVRVRELLPASFELELRAVLS